MKTKKISWQAIAIVALALVLIAAIALGVSGAWFQDKDAAGTDATLGQAVEVRLQDVNDSTATDGIKGWASLYNSATTKAYPGDRMIGKTQIRMASTTPALIRMQVVPTVQHKTLKAGTTDQYEYTDADLNYTEKNITVGENTIHMPTKLKAGTGETQEQIDAAIKAYYNALMDMKPTYSNNVDGYNTAFGTYKEYADNWNKFLLKNMTSDLALKAPAEGAAGWIKEGDWMYYSQVYSDESKIIVLFDEAYLNKYLTNEVAEWKINIKLNVEAIQAAHANEESHPWNVELVKESLKTLYGETTENASNAATTVLGYNKGRSK